MARIEVQKTYKMYMGGAFPRTESGRYYALKLASGEQVNVCQASKKDFRNAVVIARKALGGWSSKAAFNRGQILYRIAEMLEGRRAQFIQELAAEGLSKGKAEKEVDQAIDCLVYYCGWCDKYQQVFGTINPVASAHFNFSDHEPTGVVAAIAPAKQFLAGLVGTIAPIIAGGNTCIILANEKAPLSSISFAEVLNSSDVPGGVVNILTGFASEMAAPMGSHMDVNAVVYADTDQTLVTELQQLAAGNVKQIRLWGDKDFTKEQSWSPYLIIDLQEVKTTWHPIERIGGSGSSY